MTAPALRAPRGRAALEHELPAAMPLDGSSDTTHGHLDLEALPPAVRALDMPPAADLEWAVDDLWIAGDIGLLVGDGGSFKSTTALHMAAAVAGGYDVFDRYTTRARAALVISAEDPADVVKNRLDAFVQGHGWDRERVLGNVHLMEATDASLGELRWQGHIAAAAKRIDAGFIVLDPLAELIAGDENSNSDLRPVIKFLRRLAKATAAAVCVVHHAGKAGGDKRLLDRIRGASALVSASRTAFFLDFSSAGVTVEHLKMSRAPRLDRFVLTREIRTAPGNRASWISARMRTSEARTAPLSRSEEWVLTQVTAAPRRYGSSDLRRLSIGSGVSVREINDAIRRLELLGRIGFEPAPRNGKKWFPITDSTLTVRVGEPTLTTLTDPVQSGSFAPIPDPDPLKEGQGGSEHADPDRVGID